mmetsp:Transcript_35881/g.41598  ORF Transcript_35881/g.41598 Transcript_35881/m.41598 type:complete len:80 (+) Transcript_35881:82-321(+)
MSNTTSPPDGKSIISKKVSATLKLREMSLRTQDVATELLSLHNVFKDKNQYGRQKKQSLAVLKHKIVQQKNGSLMLAYS